MFGKFFASTFTGSMMAAGADVFSVWGYAIAHAVDARVELNPRLLAAVIGSQPERMKAAIEYLCEPDPDSRSSEREGRRLVREGEFQYFVTNHAKYRGIRDESDRREYNRLKKREERERKRVSGPQINGGAGVNQSVNDSQRLSSVSAHTEAESETDKKESVRALGRRARDKNDSQQSESLIAAREGGPTGAHAHDGKSPVTDLAQRKTFT